MIIFILNSKIKKSFLLGITILIFSLNHSSLFANVVKNSSNISTSALPLPIIKTEDERYYRLYKDNKYLYLKELEKNTIDDKVSKLKIRKNEFFKCEKLGQEENCTKTEMYYNEDDSHVILGSNRIIFIRQNKINGSLSLKSFNIEMKDYNPLKVISYQIQKDSLSDKEAFSISGLSNSKNHPIKRVDKKRYLIKKSKHISNYFIFHNVLYYKNSKMFKINIAKIRPTHIKGLLSYDNKFYYQGAQVNDLKKVCLDEKYLTISNGALLNTNKFNQKSIQSKEVYPTFNLIENRFIHLSGREILKIFKNKFNQQFNFCAQSELSDITTNQRLELFKKQKQYEMKKNKRIKAYLKRYNPKDYTLPAPHTDVDKLTYKYLGKIFSLDKKYYYKQHRIVNKVTKKITKENLKYQNVFEYPIHSDNTFYHIMNNKIYYKTQHMETQISTNDYQNVRIIFNPLISTPPRGNNKSGKKRLYFGDRPPFFSAYAIDDTNVFLQGEIITNADPETFQILSYSYAKDHQRVFYKGVHIKGAIPGSFMNLKNGYSRDSKNVFYKNKIMDVADLESFSSFRFFAKDKKHIYRHDKIIPKADPKTFKIHGSYINSFDLPIYASDANYVYCDFNKIKNSNGKSFSLISSRRETIKKDKNQFYEECEAIPIKKSPKLPFDSNYKVKDHTITYKNRNIRHSNLLGGYSIIQPDYIRIQKSVFYKDLLIVGADVKSFKVIKNGYSKDNKYIFYKEKKIMSPRLKTFAVLNSNYAEDKFKIYFKGKIILGATPKNIQILNDITIVSNGLKITNGILQ